MLHTVQKINAAGEKKSEVFRLESCSSLHSIHHGASYPPPTVAAADEEEAEDADGWNCTTRCRLSACLDTVRVAVAAVSRKECCLRLAK
jgi:hypothetical protein